MAQTLRSPFEGIKDTSPRRLEKLADALLREASLDTESGTDLMEIFDMPGATFPITELGLDDQEDIVLAAATYLGQGLEWDEVAAAGIHWEHGRRIQLSGDGYYNDFGNGAHSSTTTYGMLQGGTYIDGYEGAPEPSQWQL